MFRSYSAEILRAGGLMPDKVTSVEVKQIATYRDYAESSLAGAEIGRTEPESEVIAAGTVWDLTCGLNGKENSMQHVRIFSQRK